MSSSRSSSTGSNSSWSEQGDWDQPWNVVDTLGLELPPQKSKLEKNLLSRFSFDKHREFSDLRIFSLQNSRRFCGLLDLLRFPCQPFYSSIFCCLNYCNWNPSRCFLEDSHSGKLEDLMTEVFHSSYNPEFASQFSEESSSCL